ncbi:hypothetical protein H8356DRAFT_1326281 [Neocallimastix lanati (nom. inval.)]|nr:hypothetical protein H8356DRAFT_1326281 [Neocallimastix sp. JGI-2020a]
MSRILVDLRLKFTKNNDNTTNNGNIILTFRLKLYSLESYGRELQRMLKSTLLDN